MKRNGALEFISNMKPYDILKDLDLIQFSISMKQLLEIVVEYHFTLNFSLIRCRQWNKEIYDFNLNPNPSTSTIDVLIDEVMISSIQVDSGSSMNLMNVDMIKALNLTNLLSTILILKMVDDN